jgi:hypothetical protein
MNKDKIFQLSSLLITYQSIPSNFEDLPLIDLSVSLKEISKN